MTGDPSSKLPRPEHNRESESDGRRESRPRDPRRVPDRSRSGGASSLRPSGSGSTGSRIVDPTKVAPTSAPAFDEIPSEVVEELLRTLLRSSDGFLRGQPLLQLLLRGHARKRVEEEQVREAKRRGGLRKDPVRQAVVARIVKLLRESDEIETAREVWDALSVGPRRLGGGMTIEFGSDLDTIHDNLHGNVPMLITSPRGPLKIVTFTTFRSYVREARQILHQPAR